MRYLGIFFLCIILAVGYAAFDAYKFLHTPVEQPGVDVNFEVERGATFDRVVWDLKKAGLITDVKRFQLLGRYKKALGSIKAGEYILSTSLTPPQVLEQLIKGQAHLVRLTIREGLPWWETARAIEKQGFATYEDFKDVIHDPDFLARHAIPFENAEGFLFPDTYLLNKPKKLDREQAEYIASLLVQTFWKKNIPFWRLLEASPPPNENFGSKVNEITSETTINSLAKLAEYSHLVVMRAPLPQTDEFAIAYEEDFLEETALSEDSAGKTPNPQSNGNSAKRPEERNIGTGMEKPDGPAEKQAAINQPEQGKASPQIKINPDAKDMPHGTNQSEQRGEQPDKQPESSASPLSASPQNREQEHAEQGKDTPDQETRKDPTQLDKPAPSDKKATLRPNEAEGSLSRSRQADQTLRSSLRLLSGTAYASTGTSGDADTSAPAQSTVAESSNATGAASQKTTDKDSKTTPLPMDSHKSSREAIKNSTSVSTSTASHPKIWPAGALPAKMPKHPPQNPSEIDKDALRQALTLASLVEKETGLPTERPRVAGVYTNRIQKNMLLQCDPTIIYGIGPSFSGPIRRSHLRDASNLYNTYIHPGLPPSPICSFGVDAFASALLPEKHSYLYFVATGLGKDHTFSKNLREHNKAVSVYRARMRNK